MTKFEPFVSMNSTNFSTIFFRFSQDIVVFSMDNKVILLVVFKLIGGGVNLNEINSLV